MKNQKRYHCRNISKIQLKNCTIILLIRFVLTHNFGQRIFFFKTTSLKNVVEYTVESFFL